MQRTPHGVLIMSALLCASLAAFDEPRVPSSADKLPRKVIVASAHIKPFWWQWPGLEKRLQQIEAVLDAQAELSKKKYGRTPDLLTLPECNVTAGLEGDALAISLPLEGPIQEFFARKARQYNTYIVISMNLLEDREKKIASNAAILMDRKGAVAGLYRKMHLACAPDPSTLEFGLQPGKDVPVFECDFGKLGLQICLDISFDYGWRELAKKGAEIVIWPTWRHGCAAACARSRQHRYYIVSSVWGENCMILDPIGKITASAQQPEGLLVHELDLSYAILPSWGGRLGEEGGKMKEKFGDQVGFRCYGDEGLHLFWSNDPKTSIREMARSIGVTEYEDLMKQMRETYRQAGVPGQTVVTQAESK
ncbi:MAG: hypothetical protein AMXMBFR7_19040 [Planctomycetota bacterium]